VQLVLALGSTIALLAIATLITDIVTLYILKRGRFYKKKKYQIIEKDDMLISAESENMPIIQENKTYNTT
jgi:hypothetical protein